MASSVDICEILQRFAAMDISTEHHCLTVSPFEKLPAELLIHILSFAIDDVPDCVAALSLVCVEWHNVLCSTPSLWQRLKLSDDSFDPARLRARSQLWIDRSGKLPLDVEIKSVYHDAMLPMLSYSMSAMDRWRSFTSSERVQFKRMKSRKMFEGLLEEEGGLALVVDLQPKQRYESDLAQDMHWQSDEPLSTESFKKDKKGSLKEIHVKAVRTLPKMESLVPFTSITSLIISNVGWKDMPLHQCVAFLHAFPVLSHLTLMNRFVQDPEYDPDCPSIIPVVLPHLRHLTLSIASTRCLLSHITTPALECLELVYINSSMEFNHPNIYAPGDSDDEAHDFSRSPWTDRATGVGLRSLFGRHLPPLRELVMDFADLRTKDFKWAFAVLRHLESLRIVASDMSDKVVAALAVKEMAGSDESSPSLPLLKKLHLDKCQKISGDVLLGMLESRMHAAEMGLVPKMERLEMLECTGILTEHWARAKRLLGVQNVMYRPAMAED